MIIWNTKTGEQSHILDYMKDQYLSRKFEDGSPIWQDYKPDIEPRTGFKCLLHEDNYGGRLVRASFNSNGTAVMETLPTCCKSNIPDKENLHLHMTNKHRLEYQLLEQLEDLNA